LAGCPEIILKFFKTKGEQKVMELIETRNFQEGAPCGKNFVHA